ncbi:MAG: DUF5671 domain-containing protein [Patescibacteria group bacterium]
MDKPKATPKDVFLWIGVMIALYGSIVSFIALLFEYIDHAFPDVQINYYVDPFSGGIRFAMAALIVLVPVAIILMRLIRSDINREPLKSELWARRWVLFLTLFIAGATVIIDLITLINTFLGGEITERFILKIVAVLLVASAVFLHFLADLRGYWNANPGRAKMAGIGAGIIVLAAIVSGFFIIGTPAQARMLRQDMNRTSDLQNIQWQVVNYWQQKEALPAVLGDLRDPIGGYTVPMDPETKELYRYEKTGNLSFRLCAIFTTEGDATGDKSMVRPATYGVTDENWQHGVGEVCFDRTIDPERYPSFKKIGNRQ